jgi:SAM-dependent methyltransferase
LLIHIYSYILYCRSHVHTKLLQITWDSAANSRNLRHQDVKNTKKTTLQIPEETKRFLQGLDRYIDKSCLLLDVGSGTGTLLDYIKNIQSKNYIGIDISEEMVKLAKLNHPDKTFQHVDFMNYQPPLLPSASVSVLLEGEGEGTADNITSTLDTKNKKFGTVLFNECMHYFLDLEGSIKYTSTLIQSKGTLRVSGVLTVIILFTYVNKLIFIKHLILCTFVLVCIFQAQTR